VFSLFDTAFIATKHQITPQIDRLRLRQFKLTERCAQQHCGFVRFVQLPIHRFDNNRGINFTVGSTIDDGDAVVLAVAVAVSALRNRFGVKTIASIGRTKMDSAYAQISPTNARQ
jgi:hypothetical protein